MPNLFTNSKAVAPKETAAKKAKAVEINITGMERVAAIDALMKALTTLKETEQATVKSLVKNEFVTTGCAIKRRPANFRGVEGLGSASGELRSRSSASALSAEEQVLFLEQGLPMNKIDGVEECYRINPTYFENQDLLCRVSKAIEKVKDIPDDFIELQTGVSRTVVGDDAFDVLYGKPEATVRQMLEMVGIIVLKPKFADGNLNKALEITRPLLAMAEAIAKGDAVEVQAATTPRKRAA